MKQREEGRIVISKIKIKEKRRSRDDATFRSERQTDRQTGRQADR